ncbi:HPF/RaiA family ribosome-associated protein [Persicitalea sp.]|uniref:HPF/RaiA family ribosome-associated protein n=1 Tax=Persicitalea sp. TaxID=3100273 RepID=UPI003592F4EC
MQKIERFQNIKLAIQTEDFDPTIDVLTNIRAEIKNLMRIYGSILGADVYLSESNFAQPYNKLARIRVGAPGRNYFAEASSDSWPQALSEVSGKLRRQILERY